MDDPVRPARLNRPYGVSLDLADRHPWESVQRYMREVDRRELYRGALYLSVGQTVPSDETRRSAGTVGPTAFPDRRVRRAPGPRLR